MYRSAGIDLFLGADWEGRGLGREAVGLLVRHLFESARPSPHHDRPRRRQRASDPLLRGRRVRARRDHAAVRAGRRRDVARRAADGAARRTRRYRSRLRERRPRRGCPASAQPRARASWPRASSSRCGCASAPSRAREEAPGDRLSGESFREQAEDLVLARAQLRQARRLGPRRSSSDPPVAVCSTVSYRPLRPRPISCIALCLILHFSPHQPGSGTHVACLTRMLRVSCSGPGRSGCTAWGTSSRRDRSPSRHRRRPTRR